MMINVHLNQSLVKKEVRVHIRQFINITKTKPITDRQFCYIANHIFFLQILYKLHNTSLFNSAYISLNQAIRRMYKHKCHFSYTVLNAVFHAKMFYNLNNL